MYCIKLRRTQDEFWHSRFSQIVCVVNMYADEQKMEAAIANNEPYESKYFKQQDEVKEISSMKEIKGW